MGASPSAPRSGGGGGGGDDESLAADRPGSDEVVFRLSQAHVMATSCPVEIAVRVPGYEVLPGPEPDEIPVRVPACKVERDPKKPFVCETCRHAFATASNRARHRRKHNRVMPWVCNVRCCEMAFADQSNFLRHIRFHDRDRPFSCPVCATPFSRRYSMTSHCRTIHKHHR